jgi:multimeric flavodoxin WrbA
VKITVLNGSPKGDLSVTMQYVHYISKHNPAHEFIVHNISHDIKKIEKDEQSFNSIIKDVRSSHAVLWAFPLYYCLVASQYKRFIELVFERGAGGAFRNKYAASLTTSIHFYDHTAHAYIRAVSEDLGMKFAATHSPDMYDLTMELGRMNLLQFANQFFYAVENKIPANRVYPPMMDNKFSYKPVKSVKRADQGDKKILILTDLQKGEKNLDGMVGRLASSFLRMPEIINLRDHDIKGGCLGCIQCGYDNSCVYGDSDDYHSFFESKVKPADILFFCGSIYDRYLSSKWKQYFDRSFYNNHVPVYLFKQIGYLVSGNLGGLPFVRQIFEGFTEMQCANLVDIVTDESGDSKLIDSLISGMADSAVRYSKASYIRPYTYLALGGRKIFRDDVFSRLKFPFVADTKYYKKIKLFDFPQKKRKERIINSILSFMVKFLPFREEVYKRRMKDEMVKPLRKYVK